MQYISLTQLCANSMKNGKRQLPRTRRLSGSELERLGLSRPRESPGLLALREIRRFDRVRQQSSNGTRMIRQGMSGSGVIPIQAMEGPSLLALSEIIRFNTLFQQSSSGTSQGMSADELLNTLLGISTSGNNSSNPLLSGNLERTHENTLDAAGDNSTQDRRVYNPSDQD